MPCLLLTWFQRLQAKLSFLQIHKPKAKENTGQFKFDVLFLQLQPVCYIHDFRQSTLFTSFKSFVSFLPEHVHSCCLVKISLLQVMCILGVMNVMFVKQCSHFFCSNYLFYVLIVINKQSLAGLQLFSIFRVPGLIKVSQCVQQKHKP